MLTQEISPTACLPSTEWLQECVVYWGTRLSEDECVQKKAGDLASCGQLSIKSTGLHVSWEGPDGQFLNCG